MKICVIGLGEVGAATFLAMQKSVRATDDEFIGVDVSREALARAHKAAVRPVSLVSVVPEDADVYILSLWARADLLSFAERISKFPNLHLLSIESTIHPADIWTYRSIFRDKEEKLVTCPHRMMPGDDEHQIFNLYRVMGGWTSEAKLRGLQFYHKFMSPTYVAAYDFETAALCKVFENTYRFMEIAIAQELFEAASKCDFDMEGFNYLRMAMNSKWNIKVLEARDGVKGKCLPKDSGWFLEAFPDSQIVKAAIAANEDYKEKHGQP